MSVQRCKHEVTSGEFQRWRMYKQRRWNRHDKLDHLFAKLCATIERVNSKKPASVDESKYLLRFVFKRKQPITIDQDEKVSRSKAFWLGITSFGKNIIRK